jgi:hypothetical protein
VVYLIALAEGFEHGSTPTEDDLQALKDGLDLEADAWLLDIDGKKRGVLNDYCAEETSGDCSASVSVVLDQDMRVQFLGATHEKDGSNALDVMRGLFEE